MTVSNFIVQSIIRELLKGNDYRHLIVAIINEQFLQFAIDFFKKIYHAKANGVILNSDQISSDFSIQDKNIDFEWYKDSFLDENLQAEDIAIHSGLNKKTIHNMRKSSAKNIVIEESKKHIDLLIDSINRLLQVEPEISSTLKLRIDGKSVELNLNEILLVVNTLAVKRSGLRGGAWSSAGKRVEKCLMETLCRLYSVPSECYSHGDVSARSSREVDFYLKQGNISYKCEVKLMGSGNPESADAVFARESKVFVADKLSNANKRQLSDWGIHWVELRSDDGFRRFATVLKNLEIEYEEPPAIIDNKKLDRILDNVFSKVFA